MTESQGPMAQERGEGWTAVARPEDVPPGTSIDATAPLAEVVDEILLRRAPG